MANRARIDLNIKRPNGTFVFTAAIAEAETLSLALAAAIANLQAQTDAANANGAEKSAAMTDILGA